MNERLTASARLLRRRQTLAERKLWNSLRNRQLAGFKFRRQVPQDRYIVDFLCKEANLVIELDGGQHAGSEAERDRKRTVYLEQKGLYVLRFWINDVLDNIEGVLSAIQDLLHERSTPSPDASRHPLPEGRGYAGNSGKDSPA